MSDVPSRPRGPESLAPRAAIGAGRWLALTALALGLLCALISVRYRAPAPADAAAPAGEFSATRAMATLEALVGAGVPHPLGSEAQAKLHDALMARLTALGAAPQLQRSFACRAGRCAFVEDIVARLAPWKDSGGALLLLAHDDSVAAGPGAGDDGSGVAAALEIARALASSPPLLRDVLLVLTDGEEDGLLGAQAFFDDNPLAKDLAGVVNLDARGGSGLSLMFQEVGGDGRFIEALAKGSPHPVSNSLMAAVYERMPNDSDLTVAGKAGLPGLNFAFLDDFESYHSPLDTVARLSPATVQHQGENALGVLRALSNALDDPPLPPRVWFDVMAGRLVSFPRSWALPLAALTLSWVIGLGLLLQRRDPPARPSPPQRRWLAGLGPPIALVGASLSATLLALALRAAGALSAPFIAEPGPFELACLGLGLLWVAGCARWLSVDGWGARRWAQTVASSAVLALAAAAWLPGASYVFLVPALLGSAASLPLWAWPRPWLYPLPTLSLVLGTVAVSLPNVQLLVLALGVSLPWVYGAIAALMLAQLRPLFAAQSPRVARAVVAAGAATFVVGAVAAFATPAFTRDFPQRLDLRLHQDADQKSAQLVADTSWAGQRYGKVPSAVKTALGPSASEGREVPWRRRPVLEAAMPYDASLSPPAFEILAQAPGLLRVHVAPTRGGRVLWLYDDRDGPASAVVQGQHTDLATGLGPTRGSLLSLFGVPPGGVDVDLATAEASRVTLAEATAGLPAPARAAAAARGALALPYQGGDDTVVSVRVR